MPDMVSDPNSTEELMKRLQGIEDSQAHIIATLARFEDAIGSFLGGMQAAAAGGGMTGMLARAVMPTDQPMNKPRLGG